MHLKDFLSKVENYQLHSWSTLAVPPTICYYWFEKVTFSEQLRSLFWGLGSPGCRPVCLSRIHRRASWFLTSFHFCKWQLKHFPGYPWVGYLFSFSYLLRKVLLLFSRSKLAAQPRAFGRELLGQPAIRWSLSQPPYMLLYSNWKGRFWVAPSYQL